MGREATFRYKTLTVNHEEAVDCINVNDYVIYRQDIPEKVCFIILLSVVLLFLLISSGLESDKTLKEAVEF